MAAGSGGPRGSGGAVSRARGSSKMGKFDQCQCCEIWRSIVDHRLARCARPPPPRPGEADIIIIVRAAPDFVKKESATSASSRSAAQAADAGRSDRAAYLARAYRER
jgi:hypothetical protein